MTPKTKEEQKRFRPTYAFGLTAFVPHPHLRGLYIKTHLCVDHVACPLCGAEVYEPCRRVKRRSGEIAGWGSDTHYQRRKAFGKLARA